MINSHEIVNCINLTLEKIISRDSQEIEKVCKEDRFPAKYVIKEIDEYPGDISYPKQIYVDDKKIMLINENDLFVYFNLWFDNKESDLIVTIHIIKKSSHLDFYIDEVHVH